MRTLPATEREALLARFYRPYRERFAARVAAELARGRAVLHVSCHSFTPVLDGRERAADVGFLFDPQRTREAAFGAAWLRRLRDEDPALRVRRNYPYRGTADCFVGALRRRFAPEDYAGLQLEVNQCFPLEAPREWRALRRRLARTLAATLGRLGNAVPACARLSWTVPSA